MEVLHLFINFFGVTKTLDEMGLGKVWEGVGGESYGIGLKART